MAAQSLAPEIICADALQWMAATDTRGPVATSLPDADEIGATMGDWRAWFVGAALACMRLARPGDRAVFYQTDRKAGGETHSKAALLLCAASTAGASLLWHKIALRRPVGAVDLHRPGYTHVMAFGRNSRPGRATPDVFDAGKPLYKNGIGANTARFMVSAAGRTDAPLIDPFCGRGTLLRVAAEMGFTSIGVDVDPAQCAAAAAHSSPNLAAMAA